MVTGEGLIEVQDLSQWGGASIRFDSNQNIASFTRRAQSSEQVQPLDTPRTLHLGSRCPPHKLTQGAIMAYYGRVVVAPLLRLQGYSENAHEGTGVKLCRASARFHSRMATKTACSEALRSSGLVV